VTVVSVRFADGQLEAFTGCNRASGPYSIEGDRVRIGDLAGTMMACDDAVMAVEAAVKSALSGVLRFEVAQDRLTLTADSGTVLVFRVESAPKPPAR
jgi:putative lipoprotein